MAAKYRQTVCAVGPPGQSLGETWFSSAEHGPKTLVDHVWSHLPRRPAGFPLAACLPFPPPLCCFLRSSLPPSLCFPHDSHDSGLTLLTFALRTLHAALTVFPCACTCAPGPSGPITRGSTLGIVRGVCEHSPFPLRSSSSPQTLLRGLVSIGGCSTFHQRRWNSVRVCAARSWLDGKCKGVVCCQARLATTSSRPAEWPTVLGGRGQVRRRGRRATPTRAPHFAHKSRRQQPK